MIIVISLIESQLQSLLILNKRVLTANRGVGNFEHPRHDPAREETNIDKSSDKKELSIKSK